MVISTSSGAFYSGQPRTSGNNDEADLRTEPDLPSDGPDDEGEEMIRNLPARPELSEPPTERDRKA